MQSYKKNSPFDNKTLKWFELYGCHLTLNIGIFEDFINTGWHLIIISELSLVSSNNLVGSGIM